MILLYGEWDTLLKRSTMNHDHNQDHTKSEGPHSLPVCFAVTDSTASNVLIAGTFDNWQPEAEPIHPVGIGRWVKKTALPPGTYEYCVVVDRKRTSDPLAKKTRSQSLWPNGFGSENELVHLKPSPTQPETFATTGKIKD